MSSSVSSRYLRLYRSTVHPFLAVSIPTLFLVCLDSMARAILPFIRFPSPLFLLVLVAVGAEEAVMANILFAERAGFAARLRELLVVLLALWLALAVQRRITAQVLAPFHVEYIYPLALAFTQWVIVWATHRCLREREILLGAISGKGGEEMLHTLRDASLQAGIAVRSLRGVKRIVSFFQTVVFISLVIALTRGAPVGARALFLCALHALYGFLVTGMLNMHVENQLLLGEGIAVPGRLESSRIVGMIGVLLICLPLALLVARNEAPLPLSTLLAFFERLFRFFPSIPSGRIAETARGIIEQQRRYFEMLRTAPVAPVNPIFLLYFELLRRLFVSAVAMGLYFFLVSPLLSEDFLENVRKRSLIAFLRRKLRAFFRFCRGVALRIRAWLRSPERGSRWEREAHGDPPNAAGGIPARRVPWKKRLQMSRVLKAFLRLLRWGEVQGVAHRMSDTPQEYALRLATVVPNRSAQLTVVVEVLEEALFSTHLLSAERIAGYYSSLRDIQRNSGSS